MTRHIHPTAVVDPEAELAEGVTVGPHAVVGAEVVLGEGTEVGAGVHILGPTRLGRENRICSHACLGFDPQDVKFHPGQESRLVIGHRNLFRELVTVHRGTGGGGGVTTVGDDNFFMVGSHVGHDCHVGSRVTFINSATLAGHVEVGDDATVGAFSAVHQGCRVGRHAFIGGYSVITMDALPYVKTVGTKARVYGINRIGLRRKGFDREALGRLEAAFRLLLASGLNTRQALTRIRDELGGHPEVDYLLEFAAGSRRGLIKTRPGRRSGRGREGEEP